MNQQVRILTTDRSTLSLNDIFTTQKNGWVTFKVEPEEISYVFDGVKPTTVQVQQPDFELSMNGGYPLFRRRNNGSAVFYEGAKVKVAAFKIWKNGILTVDAIPVRIKDEDGNDEGAMYDKVSRTISRNRGTGKFIIGPDK